MKSFIVHFSASVMVQAQDAEEAEQKVKDLTHVVRLMNVEVNGMDDIIPDREDFTGATPGDR